jgi:hypothetical protein
VKQGLSREEVIKILTSHRGNEQREKSIFDQWVHSDRFELMEIPIVVICSQKVVGPSCSEGPIIVDACPSMLNHNCSLSQLIYSHIIQAIDGNHRLAAAKKRGDTKILAYAGTNAICYIKNIILT